MSEPTAAAKAEMQAKLEAAFDIAVMGDTFLKIMVRTIGHRDAMLIWVLGYTAGRGALIMELEEGLKRGQDKA